MKEQFTHEEVSRRMRCDIESLLNMKPEENRHWQLTKLDLMEMIHAVYLQGNVYDELGRPATFLWMVRRICANLHIPVPHNPRSMVSKSLLRKGVRQRWFVERYAWMLSHRQEENLLQIFIH